MWPLNFDYITLIAMGRIKNVFKKQIIKDMPTFHKSIIF